MSIRADGFGSILGGYGGGPAPAWLTTNAVEVPQCPTGALRTAVHPFYTRFCKWSSASLSGKNDTTEPYAQGAAVSSCG
jgi:hypothetical protein